MVQRVRFRAVSARKQADAITDKRLKIDSLPEIRGV
jgi:hypothetical protein